MVLCGSQVSDYTSDLQARSAKVQQQTRPQAGRFEIICALRPVRVVQCLDNFQLNQQHIFNQQVRKVFTNHYVIVVHRDTALLHNREAGGTQFVANAFS
jgi:hypothetical protein